jgi:DnaJ-class molecular chaperone
VQFIETPRLTTERDAMTDRDRRNLIHRMTTAPKKCSRCKGTGILFHDRMTNSPIHCPMCQGTGRIDPK